VHPTRDQAAAIESGGAPGIAPPADLTGRVRTAAGDEGADIDWPAVERAALERSGIPVQVAVRRATFVAESPRP
jgi:hypothetical protein